jgi:hypothetical protein
MVSEPLPETVDQIGPVLVTVDTIEGKGPFLPQLYDEWEQVSSPQFPPRRFDGIWSEDVDPLRNHADILAVWGAPRDKARGQPLRHRVDVFGYGNADFNLAPEWVEAVEQSYRSRSEITLAGMLQDSGQSASALGALGQLIASGSLVHFHLHLNQSRLRNQQPDAHFIRWIWSKVIQGQAPLADLLNVSVFARENREYDLQRQWSGFLFERFVHAIVGAAQEQVAKESSGTEKHLSIAVHSSRYLNHDPKDGIFFSEDIPVEYSPGSALVGSLLLKSLVSPSVATGTLAQGAQLNTMIGENVSQREFFSDLWSVLFHGESLAKDVAETGNSKPVVEVSDPLSAGDPLEAIAFVHGAQGVLQVFSAGWIFLPRSVQANQDHQESYSGTVIPKEPLFGIGLDRVAEARRLMFAAAQSHGQVALELFFPALESRAIRSAEIRSEFPVRRCGSSDSSVTFANGFGFDGAMVVTIGVGDQGQDSKSAGGLGTLVRCIVDTGRANPIPKRASVTELEQINVDAASPQRLRRRSSPPNVSVRFVQDGVRVQTSEITVGPYGEPAQRNLASDPLSSRTTVSFDILKDRDRLLRVWGSAPVFQPGLHSIWLRGVGSSEAEQYWSDAGPLAVTTDWEKEVDDFVDRRIKQAQKPRQND